MSKKIKAFYDVAEKRIIIADDNVEKGDYIFLEDILNFDQFIEESIDKKYKTKIINEFKNSQDYQSLMKQNTELDAKNKALEQEKELAIKNAKNEGKNEVFQSKEYQDLRNYKEDSALKINNLENEISNSKTNAILEFKESSEFKNLLKIKDEKVKLEADIANLNKNNQLEKEKLQLELERKFKDAFDKEKEKLNEQYDFELRKKDAEISSLTTKYNLLNNTKRLGEDFENQCLNDYNNSLGQFVNDSMFEKATENKNGTKPDFIFKVYANDLHSKEDNPLLTTVVLEMKTESINSDDKNKKKNADHLQKLEKDRLNNNGDLAILVTELEKDDNFVIKRDPLYPNIIIIRPLAMIPVLTIIRSLALKNKEVFIKSIEFKNQQEILDEFNKFKDNILNNSLKNLGSQVEKIIKTANEIISKANDILESANVVLNSHKATIQNKIESFSIQKITKKIDKLEKNSSTSNVLTSGEHMELDEEDIKLEKIKQK